MACGRAVPLHALVENAQLGESSFGVVRESQPEALSPVAEPLIPLVDGNTADMNAVSALESQSAGETTESSTDDSDAKAEAGIIIVIATSPTSLPHWTLLMTLDSSS